MAAIDNADSTGTAMDKQKWPTIVVYVDENRRVWAKEQSDFLESFKEIK